MFEPTGKAARSGRLSGTLNYKVAKGNARETLKEYVSFDAE
jgi:hypothetical protein